MAIKLDLIDNQILYELDINCRKSNNQIAKKLKLSRQVVNYRIKKLESLKIIKNYYTVINMCRLGYISNRIFFRFKSIPTNKEKEIIDFFVKDPKYWGMVVSEGLLDLGIATWEKDFSESLKTKEEYMSVLGEYIQYYVHSYHLQMYIYRKEYLVKNKISISEPIYMIKESINDFDELDFKILRIISINSRMSTINIAKNVKSTVDVVRYRIKKMINNKIIEGFRPAIDISKLGYQMYKVELMLKDYTQKQKMIDYFGAHPNIMYAYETTNNDLEFELEVKNMDEFLEILGDIRNKFSNVIKSYNQVLWYKEYKVTFFNK